MSVSEQSVWESIRRNAGPYPPEAFLFVQEGFRHTVDRLENTIDRDLDASEEGRHISGQEVCLGLRDFAVEQYGLLARTVLGHWNIHRTEDFGRIVFALVDAGLMRKAEHDSAEDFIGVFDFDEVFGRHFERC